MIRVCVIGGGRWGPNLIRNFHDGERSTVTWIVDNDEAQLDRVAARYRGVRTSPSLDDALAGDDVDAVVVATPTTTHFELTRTAIAAGKHVLVEKPITHDSAQARELIELAEQRGTTLMVGHVFVYNGAVRAAKSYIERGDLGRLYYISMVRTNLGPIRMDVNAAWDLAAHDISIANYWLESTPTSVSASGGSWINAGIEDTVFATLRYPNQVVVHVHASWLNPRKARMITVTGESAMLTFDDMDVQEPLRIYDSAVSDETTKPAFIDNLASFRASLRNGDITIPRVSLGEPLRSECEHFLDSIEFSQAPLSGGQDGLDVVLALEAIERSQRQKGLEVEVER